MNGSFYDAINGPHGGQTDQQPGGRATPKARGHSPGGNPFLGIQFECCKTYGRIYRDPTGMKYAGRCPKCLKKIEVPIGQGGSGSRFFRAS